MPKRRQKPDWITQQEWNEADIPELTAEELSRFRPAIEVVPDIAARATRGPGKKPVKTLVSIRLDQSVVKAFKATGAGWQSRVNATLSKDIADGRIFGADGRLFRPASKRKSKAKRSGGASRKRA